MRKKEGKGRRSAAGITCFKHRKYQGFCFFQWGRLREREGKEDGSSFSLFSLFYGDFMEIFGIWKECEREKKGKKRTLQEKSYKVPNLAFYSVVSNSFEKIL